MNESNLVPQSERTKEEQRRIARMGGIASGKVRKERKALKEELLMLLAKGDTQERVSLALIQEALQGNTKAFEVIRDTIGEKPVDKLEADVGLKTIRVELEDE